MWWWFLVPATYLLGSVSFAWIAGRVKGIDLRQHGSGNLGATNAGRVLGRHWFFLVFVLDLAKGLGPVLLARWAADHAQADTWLPICTAAAAILGHSFTCFHGFKGGKAVATSLGVLIGLLWKVAAIAAVAWLVVWLAQIIGWRRKPSAAVGLASVVAAVTAPIAHLATFTDPWSLLNLPLTVFVLLVSLLVVVRHRTNLRQLFSRTKPTA